MGRQRKIDRSIIRINRGEYSTVLHDCNVRKNRLHRAQILYLKYQQTSPDISISSSCLWMYTNSDAICSSRHESICDVFKCRRHLLAWMLLFTHRYIGLKIQQKRYSMKQENHRSACSPRSLARRRVTSDYSNCPAQDWTPTIRSPFITWSVHREDASDMPRISGRPGCLAGLLVSTVILRRCAPRRRVGRARRRPFLDVIDDCATSARCTPAQPLTNLRGRGRPRSDWILAQLPARDFRPARASAFAQIRRDCLKTHRDCDHSRFVLIRQCIYWWSNRNPYRNLSSSLIDVHVDRLIDTLTEMFVDITWII